MADLSKLTAAMVQLNCGDPKHVYHFLEVYGFAKAIGESEGLDARTQLILEVAALTHDIGIRPAILTHGYQNGKLQEQIGPGVARDLLAPLGFDAELIERVCWLIAHHHTTDPVEGIDHQILLEADFLVNLNGKDVSAVTSVREKVFKTALGLRLLDSIFLQENPIAGK